MLMLFCSGGGIRTHDQLVNSQLRYRCATPECGYILSTNNSITKLQLVVNTYFDLFKRSICSLTKKFRCLPLISIYPIKSRL